MLINDDSGYHRSVHQTNFELATSIQMKKGDTVKCNKEGLLGFTKDFLYKITDSYPSGNIEIKDDNGILTYGYAPDFDLCTPTIPHSGTISFRDNRDYPAGAWTTDADAWTEPKCDFGCKYAFGNEHLDGCSLSGEIK